MVVCIALGVDMFRRGLCPPLYIREDRVTWKILAEYCWSPNTTQSGSFFCTAASSMPIRVVTKEVRYIHELPYSRTFYVYKQSPCPGSDIAFQVLLWLHRGCSLHFCSICNIAYFPKTYWVLTLCWIIIRARSINSLNFLIKLTLEN